MTQKAAPCLTKTATDEIKKLPGCMTSGDGCPEGFYGDVKALDNRLFEGQS